MALSKFEIKQCEQLINRFLEENRPSAHIKNEVDISCKLNNQTVEVLELRPHFKDKDIIIEQPIAKATYIKSKKIWHIYWQGSNLTWRRYEPCPKVSLLEDFFTLIKEDKHACFFG
ncbi:hypothetical protein OA92_02200 [Marinomonas sp. SBI22]|uniref:DUF3024 domain-containing protein n=1 Tax=unclassified Marinomonas TaxID=196814 RepID=UPI0007AF9780|nr:MULTISPECIES: DUF3024 domain-containing protein [unclassified Marinomonas]KZM40809.1 hypothetical protein OA91_19295 [Marinomonas sp. SBI8L]KZM46006.1 hypothetical protein OA92_02200 [Marinomonas sp. SBI22]